MLTKNKQRDIIASTTERLGNIMWSKSNSIKLSSILVKVLFVCLIAAVFLIPFGARYYDYVSTGYYNGTVTRATVFVPLCITLYFTLVPAFILLVKLNRLLENIRADKVFVNENCGIMRLMSYCCFAAGFMGLILRVLKNVFAKAVELREENDSVI